MRIGHCFFKFELGGAQVLTVNMINEMSKSNEVSLIIINGNWNEKLIEKVSSRVKIYKINRKEGSYNPYYILKLNLILFKLRLNILHAHEPKIVKLIFIKLKKLLTIHTVGMNTKTFHSYNLLASISKSVAKDVKLRSKIDSDIIYNGIKVDDFQKRSNYTLGKYDVLKIVQVSRLVHDIKGQDILIRALAKYIKKQEHQAISLDFIGEGTSKMYLMQLVEQLGVQDYISFVGEKSHSWICNNLKNYHLVVQPSRYEGFGLTIAESIVSGVPVIASNIEGPAEILEDIPGGYLFESGNVEDCLKVILKVVEDYKLKQLDYMMLKSCELITKKYAVETTAKHYLTVYNAL